MDFFRRERLLFWCVLVLMLLNAALVVSFWLKRPPFPPPGPGGPRGGGRIMETQLQLSAEQVQAFDQVRNEHFTRSDPLQERVYEIRMALLNEIFAAEPNEATIEALTAEIGQVQRQFDRELFEHFRDLKNVCKDRQVQELKHLLVDLLANLHESRRPPDPRQPHPGPERGPGPGHPPPPPGPEGGPGPGHPLRPPQ